MAGSVGAHKGAVECDLDGVFNKPDPDDLSAVAVAHAIGGAGKAHRAMGVDFARDLAALGGLSRLSML